MTEATAERPIVRLSRVHQRYGRQAALTDLSLDIRKNEMVFVSGPSGAGKTTLLKLLAGLLPLHSGEATVLGTDLGVDRRSHRRRLALVGHDTGCYDDLTVRENLRFAARAAGGHAGSADAAMHRLGLDPIADVVHARLSAGQRRRLALAVALGRDPELLLLDEPHAGLDAEGREVLDALLRDARAEGRTVLVASHELDRTRALADREVVVRGGRAYPVEAA